MVNFSRLDHVHEPPELLDRQFLFRRDAEILAQVGVPDRFGVLPREFQPVAGILAPPRTERGDMAGLNEIGVRRRRIDAPRIGVHQFDAAFLRGEYAGERLRVCASESRRPRHFLDHHGRHRRPVPHRDFTSVDCPHPHVIGESNVNRNVLSVARFPHSRPRANRRAAI